MADPTQYLPGRRACLTVTIGAAALLFLLLAPPIYFFRSWIVPAPHVSTLPAAPADDRPHPAPALLVHTKFTAPQITLLLEQVYGAQGLMIAAMLPYEATLQAAPNDAGTAVDATVTISAPRSAAALQVFLRQYVGQASDNGYVLRDVALSEPGVLALSIAGPLAGPAAVEALPDPPPSPPREDDHVMVVAIRNHSGDWTRIVEGSLEHAPMDPSVSPVDWTAVVSADITGRFIDRDCLAGSLDITCVSPEAAARVRNALEQALEAAQANGSNALEYQREIELDGPRLRAEIRVCGIVKALRQAIEEAYRLEMG